TAYQAAVIAARVSGAAGPAAVSALPAAARTVPMTSSTVNRTWPAMSTYLSAPDGRGEAGGVGGAVTAPVSPKRRTDSRSPRAPGRSYDFRWIRASTGRSRGTELFSDVRGPARRKPGGQ